MIVSMSSFHIYYSKQPTRESHARKKQLNKKSLWKNKGMTTVVKKIQATTQRAKNIQKRSLLI